MVSFPHVRLFDPNCDLQLTSEVGEARVARFQDDSRVAIYWRGRGAEMFAVAICDTYAHAVDVAQTWVEEAVVPGERRATNLVSV